MLCNQNTDICNMSIRANNNEKRGCATTKFDQARFLSSAVLPKDTTRRPDQI